MRYDDVGSGPPVVLLHSGVCDRRMWQAQTGALSADFRVVSPDLRGFGETPLPPERFSNSTDVRALLDQLELERVHLVGSSFGGKVALEFATRWPERVTSLALLCSAFAGVDPSPAVQEFGTQEEALLEADDVDGAVDLNVATWLGPEASAEAVELVRVMQRHAFDVQLAADAGDVQPEVEPYEPDPRLVTAPTLVVSGALDLDHFQTVAERLVELIPDVRLVSLSWAGHLPSLERPAEVTELLRGFWQGRLD